MNPYERKYYFKIWNESRWLKLFYHNFEPYNGFRDDNEALKSNVPNKYSILYKLDDNLKYRGVFEFLLEYPSYTIHWKQDDNPITLDEKNYNVVPGLFVYPCTANIASFKGLALSTIELGGVKNTFLDGIPGHGNWHYAVGMYNYTENFWYYTGIPGASGAEKRVTLWVRVSNNFSFYPTNNMPRKAAIWPFVLIIILFS